jgi:hypothetical protein
MAVPRQQILRRDEQTDRLQISVGFFAAMNKQLPSTQQQ